MYTDRRFAPDTWEANQRLQEARAARLKRIAQAEARGEAPKHRDIRHHSRTLVLQRRISRYCG